MNIKNCVIKHAECENTFLIQQLERDLAEVDRVLSANAWLIDRNPPGMWPKGSILGKACERHAARAARQLAAQQS